MDAYEATKIVFQKIQDLDPPNASKIMGFLLIQDHGEKEIIRLAFGPESSLHSVILKTKKELNLDSPNMPSTTPSSPFTNHLRHSSLSRLPSPFSLTNNQSSSTPAISSPWKKSKSSDNREVDLIDELQLQDQLPFLNDGPTKRTSDFFYQQHHDLAMRPTGGNDPLLFPASAAWGGASGLHHRRSYSVSDVCLGSEDMSGGGFWWKPCLFYARGYCKNGTSCRFLHGEEAAADFGDVVEQHCEEMLRSKSSRQHLLASNSFPFSSSANKRMNFLQFPPDSPRGLMIGDGMNKFSPRGDFGIINGVSAISRQIYLTFPADSTFKEEDVSTYFSNFGPVQDVRIPYQQKRMFGFVTFDFPETVKLILAKGNPHFVCDARVLVKPYKEKGKIQDKHRKQQQQQQMDKGDFIGCGSPTGAESRDPFDLQLGARMLYNTTTQDMLWRRKLEEQADFQQAIDIQNRRFFNLQLLDGKSNNNSHHRTLSTGAVVSSPTVCSPTFFGRNGVVPSNLSSPEAKEENAVDKENDHPANGDPDNINGKESPPKKASDLHESLEHNLPDSPFAEENITTAFTLETEKGIFVQSTNNNSITGPKLFHASSSFDVLAPFKSCYFQVPRFASRHETIGMLDSILSGLPSPPTFLHNSA